MTTFGGREASVRVVPFLVANQVMFLAGLTSAICVAPARWYVYGLAVATGLWVLASSAMCIRSLYGFFGSQTADSNGRTLVLALGLTYFVGCSAGPLAWTCGHSGFDECSDTVTSAVYLAGDLLSKNLFVILAVVLKVRYLSDTPRTIRALIPGSMSEFVGIKGGTPYKARTTIEPMTTSAANSSFRERRAAEARERSLESSPRRTRRPSIGNIAIDDIQWATKDGLLTKPGQSSSRDASFREGPSVNSSPEMGQRALRGQSGFQVPSPSPSPSPSRSPSRSPSP